MNGESHSSGQTGAEAGTPRESQHNIPNDHTRPSLDLPLPPAPPPTPNITTATETTSQTEPLRSAMAAGHDVVNTDTSEVSGGSCTRRVRFPSICRRTSHPRRPTKIQLPRLPFVEVTSPFQTPPDADQSEWDWESKTSYFETPPGFGEDPQEMEERQDKSTPLHSPTRRSFRRSGHRSTFEQELRATLEGKYGDLGLNRLSSHELEGILDILESRSAPVSRSTSPTQPAPRSSVFGPKGGDAPGEPHDPDLDLEKGVIAKESSDPCTIPTATTEAHQLVRAHTQKISRTLQKKRLSKKHGSGDVTPCEGETPRASEEHIRTGILSSLLKLYNNPHASQPSLGSPHSASPPQSGRSTPKWYSKSANNSTTTLASGLLGSSHTLIAPVSPNGARTPKQKLKQSGIGGIIKQIVAPKSTMADEIRITIHIAELLSRQRYVLKLCRALMLYGAPTHRLEEYMKTTSRVLDIDGQFLYIPGCMVISFDDPSTHTSDVRIVRVNQGCDLGKLHDTHLVYKEVVHDVIGVEEGTKRLEEIMAARPKHSPWRLVFIYGCASALVGPFAFQARPIDMPISFLLGCILGWLQLIIAPKSDLYSNVFEITASVILSFLARAFGSIRGGHLFCYSALTQSSIALILPGYIILCGALELQSKNIVAGAVRMFYSIIYSLFLGFGITVGATLYGALDKNATSATSCQNPLPRPWAFLFVPLFAFCLLVVCQAKWRQAPVMVAIATVGYAVNFFSIKRFAGNAQVASSLGALAIGVMGNLYSRVGHGLAFAAMLPAVFVQVPSGLASQGSIISGIQNADAIARNRTAHNPDALNSTVLNLGFGMIQISIGLTVGLFATALFLYPFGKKRSGLFTF